MLHEGQHSSPGYLGRGADVGYLDPESAFDRFMEDGRQGATSSLDFGLLAGSGWNLFRPLLGPVD